MEVYEKWLYILENQTLDQAVGSLYSESGYCCLGAYLIAKGEKPKIVEGRVKFGYSNVTPRQLPEVPMLALSVLANLNDRCVPWPQLAKMIRRVVNRPYTFQIPIEAKPFVNTYDYYWVSKFAEDEPELSFVTGPTPMNQLVELEGNIPFIGDGEVRVWREY